MTQEEIKELSKFTTSQLSTEVHRRLSNKKKEKLLEQYPDHYVYQEAVVKEVRQAFLGQGIGKFDYIMDKDYGFKEPFYKGYRVCYRSEIGMRTRPHVGDRVLMRRYKYMNDKDDHKGIYQIWKVLERKA